MEPRPLFTKILNTPAGRNKTKSYQFSVWRHTRQVVKQLVVVDGVGSAQFLGEFVDAPRQGEVAQWNVVEDERDDRQNDDR